MRKKIAAANWKMNTTVPEGIELAKSVRQALEGVDRKCDVVLGVPFTHLCAVAEAVKGTDIIVAAEVGEGYAEDDVALAIHALKSLANTLRKLDALGDGGIHFPVGSCNFLSHNQSLLC